MGRDQHEERLETDLHFRSITIGTMSTTVEKIAIPHGSNAREDATAFWLTHIDTRSGMVLKNLMAPE